MASEGEFPKADGDVLYASEVNQFYGTTNKLENKTPISGNTALTLDWINGTFSNIVDGDFSTLFGGSILLSGTGYFLDVTIPIDEGYYNALGGILTAATEGTPNVSFTFGTSGPHDGTTLLSIGNAGAGFSGGSIITKAEMTSPYTTDKIRILGHTGGGVGSLVFNLYEVNLT